MYGVRRTLQAQLERGFLLFRAPSKLKKTIHSIFSDNILVNMRGGTEAMRGRRKVARVRQIIDSHFMV